MVCLFSCAKEVLRILGGEPFTAEQVYVKIENQQHSWADRKDQSERWEREAEKGVAGIASFAMSYIRGANKTAVHLGCGLHELSPKLCGRGWTVHAVDSSEFVVKACKRKFSNIAPLLLYQTSIEEFIFPEKVDLIYTDALSYVEPARFRSVWEKAVTGLEEGGLFIGTFALSFGLEAKGDPRTKHFGAWHVNEGEVWALLGDVGEILFCKESSEGGSRKICFVAQKITRYHHKEL